MRALHPALLTASTLAGLAFLAAPCAIAQPVDRSQLPSLTPAVFESRGTVAVTLPQVDRQPLSGFGPLPRRFQVAADREPNTLPFAPDPDALPTLALAPPQPPAPSDLVVRRLRAEAGGGTESTLYGRLDLAASGAGGEFFVDADYDDDGSNPTVIGEAVRFETIALRAGGRSFGPGRIGIEGAFERETYPVLSGERTRQTVGAEAGIEGLGATAYRATLGFESGRLEAPGQPESTETRLDAAARIARGWLAADAAGGVAGAGSVGSDLRYGAAGLAVTVGREDGARARIGARVLGYDAAATAGDGAATSVGPIVDLAFPLGPTVSLFAINDPHVTPRSLSDLTAQNPYVSLGPIVAPDVVPVDARAGLSSAFGRSRARVYALAFRAPTFLAFESTGAFSTTSAVDVREVYLDVSAFGLGADVALVAENGLSATASLTVRAGQTDDGGDIPYWSPLVATAGVQVPFANGRGRFGAAAHVEGTRPTDRSATDDAPAFALVSAEASYAVLGPLALVARAERLAGQAQIWPVMDYRPRTFLLGLRLQR
ncbi:hypothetical protein [Rubrivirga sp. IMCC43871]|uniref:hypothetical protein n=1 Tax=Rubrivirga sp. IMCC43871 TaxID=3391575 RepID=UPI00398F9B28